MESVGSTGVECILSDNLFKTEVGATDVRESWGKLMNVKVGQTHPTVSVIDIDVDEIVSNPFQPRTVFDEGAISELAKTIHTHGVIQPVVVRYRNGRYELIAGERRLRAVKSLGWASIPAIVKEMNDAQTASAALIENLQREGLTPIEEAVAYQQLLELHGLTQESLAQRLGKGQSTIANKLRLLHLPGDVQQALLARSITERHARALLALPGEEFQVQLLRECIDRGWNVKQMEERVQSLLLKLHGTKVTRARKRSLSKDMRIAVNTIRKSLDLIQKNGISVQVDELDKGDAYEFVIRLPKPQLH